MEDLSKTYTILFVCVLLVAAFIIILSAWMLVTYGFDGWLVITIVLFLIMFVYALYGLSI